MCIAPLELISPPQRQLGKFCSRVHGRSFSRLAGRRAYVSHHTVFVTARTRGHALRGGGHSRLHSAYVKETVTLLVNTIQFSENPGPFSVNYKKYSLYDNEVLGYPITPQFGAPPLLCSPLYWSSRRN